VAGQRTNEWKLGLFVVSALAIGFAALLWLGANRFQRRILPAWTYLDESVQGLDVGSAVKFRGVTIGSVAQISVAPDRRRVAVLMNIYEDVLASLGLRRREEKTDDGRPFVPPEVRVQLASAGLTGGKFLSLDLFDPAKTPLPELPFVVPYNYVPAAPSTLKNVEETVLKLAAELPGTLDEVKGLIGDGRKFLAALDVQRLTTDAHQLMGDLDRTITAFDAPGLNRRLDALLTNIDGTVARVDRLTADLDQFAQEGGQVQAFIDELRQTTRAMREAVEKADLAGTTASVRDGVGAVSGLTRDLSGMSGELRQALVALRDAADKVADLAEVLQRDPSSILHGRSPGPPGPGGRP
jgi:paraquat-inducible protein B